MNDIEQVLEREGFGQEADPRQINVGTDGTHEDHRHHVAGHPKVADERGAIQKLFDGGMVSSWSNRFRLDPAQSYVSMETRQKDPAFWMPKPAAKAPAKPPAKKP